MTFAVFVASTRRQTGALFASASSSSSLSSRTSLTMMRSANAFSTMSTSTTDSDSPYYTVAITGASGMLGTAVIDELSKKKDGLCGKPIRLIKLHRDESIQEGLETLLSTNTTTSQDDNNSNSNSNSNNNMITTDLNWNPNAEGGSDSISADALNSIDSLIHLAGENIGSGLLPGPLGMLGIRAWSQTKKDLIMNSRVGPTQSLAAAIAECPNPTTYIVASGVGVYGSDFMANDDDNNNNNNNNDVGRHTPDESFDVSKTKGFLAEVSRRWEAASQGAIDLNTKSNDGSKNRVVNLRLAPVLSKNGGALEKLYPIFFLGGGGIVGSGKQYFPYISARDAARAIVHIIENDTLKGPVNLTAPTPATNAEFTSALGKVMSRPTFIPLPAFIVKLMFGEMGEETLLGGVKAAPKKLLDSNFEFQHETVEQAVESAINETI